MPCVNSPLNGSAMPILPKVLQRARPEARVEQVQDRMLDPADILGDGKPLLRFRAIERLVASGWLAKRMKYQLEVDEGVERVRLARLRRRNSDRSTCFQLAWRSSGLPGTSKSMSSGSTTGSCSRGTGTAPHSPQWMIGIGVPQ